jgi:2-methylcitrate dehydratase PrpD
MPAKITLHLQDGTTFQHEVQDYPGMPSHPFAWEDSVEKFDQLVAGAHRQFPQHRDQGCRALARKHQSQRSDGTARPREELRGCRGDFDCRHPP